MTTDLRDRFDDLVAGVPDHVTADPRTAWRAGAKRRVRRRALTVAGVLGAVALAAAASIVVPKVVAPEPAGEHGDGDLTHPARIARPWRISEMAGDASGPIAGWVRRGDSWLAVTPRGELMRRDRLDPDFPFSVSPNGEKVTFVRTGIPSDLFYDDIVKASGHGSLVGRTLDDYVEFTMPLGAQVFWSPDSVRSVVTVDSGEDLRDTAALAQTSNLPPRRLAAPIPGSMLVGWTSTERVGWLSGATLVSVPFRGGAKQQTSLEPAPPAYVAASLSTSGDGRLAVVTEDSHLLLYDADGQLAEDRVLRHAWVAGCPISWSDSGPWVPSADGSGVLMDGGGSSRILADPQLGITCSVWAADALSGATYDGVGGAVFGSSTSWFSWHWRESALMALAAVGAVVGLVWRRRRRRRFPGAVARSKA